jgi:uncharacterized membrane protein
VSKELTKGNKEKNFNLDCSFIGWALLAGIPISICIIFIPIMGTAMYLLIGGLLFMYMGVSNAAFYDRARGALNY